MDERNESSFRGNIDHLGKFLIANGRAEYWNNWRAEDPSVRPSLVGLDLRGHGSLVGFDFWATDLRGANFSGVDLRQCRFTEAQMREANLSGADLRGSLLEGADLFEADLSDALLANADLQHATLQNAVLPGADLRNTHLKETNFWSANLERANLREAIIWRTIFNMANMRGADLTDTRLINTSLMWAKLEGAYLENADLTDCNLTGAQLQGANLARANLTIANLTSANLDGARLQSANLERAILVETTMRGTDINGSRVYGASVWKTETDNLTGQLDLIVTPSDEPEVRVDDLEVAQFVYLLLNNRRIRNVIDTITSRAVLILGRFTTERKRILDALHSTLREEFKLVPILFDFQPSVARDLTETVQLLAGMCRFVIADISDAKSIPQELSHIVPLLPSVPVQPIIAASQREYSMFEHWKKFNNVLPEYPYRNQDHLLATLGDGVVGPVRKWEKMTDKAAAKLHLLEEANREKDAEIARLRAMMGAE